MKNLGYGEEEYNISSRAAGIITQRYLSTGDRALLESAEESVSQADLIIFGGAPLFNYRYQDFYRKTITTLELAQEYEVPVLFSSIGIEAFDGSNPKCLELKDALNLPCVRQITTRDDYESAKKYVEGTSIPVAQVADPAVLADIVFRKAPAPPVKRPPASTPRKLARKARKTVAAILSGNGSVTRKIQRRGDTAARAVGERSAPRQERVQTPISQPSSGAEPVQPLTSEQRTQPRKRIGLFVARRGLFKDNKIPFTAKKQHKLWTDVIASLSQKGYDYKLLTTGHYADEVFLDDFVRKNNISPDHFKCPINRPEDLISELKACDGIIAYRLHASITSFAFGIPSIGLSWNFKVPYFYETAGYSQRALAPEHWKAPELVDAVETAIDEGVERAPEMAMSVYNSLFTGVRTVFQPDSATLPHTLDDLRERMPRSPVTSYALYRERVGRKMRRTYENFIKEKPSV
ncbi:MAG: polysaccharide pyruvyl transferase family protein [Ancrocorticia sp.]|uniref:polysaccharide pyruvyl transferase family protein n=1 Tax=Ancrocorticia sp. TaxID=2593684 RepID=UPI003F8F248F